MKEIIFQKTQTVTSIEVLSETIILILEEAHKKANKRLGYVSGIISSDGPKNIARNVKKLEEYTERLREKNNFPIFSAADIFYSELFLRINGKDLKDHHFLKFWREILESGYVTDIFMTPGWERSIGAKDEHETARKMGIKIHYLR